MFFTLLFFWFGTMEGHVVVFGGEHEPVKDTWKQEAFALGQYIAKANVDLITGGAPSGLMRALANGFVAEGSTSTLRAIVREAYRENPVHPGIPLEQILWPKTRHACLEEFFTSSDLFIVLPGGLGTVLEFLDCLLHNRDEKKTLMLLNLDGYWDPILEQIQRITSTHVRAAACTESLFIATSAKECIEMLQSRCFYLQGASRSGKSTICQELKTSSECCVVDSLYPAFLLETLAANYPQECVALQGGLDDENIRHALTRDLCIFKITATEKQKKECQQAIKTLQRVFSDPKTYSTHQENFRSFSRDRLRQGAKTAPYLFTTDGKRESGSFFKKYPALLSSCGDF